MPEMLEEKLKDLHKLRMQKDGLTGEMEKLEKRIEDLNAMVTDEFESRQIQSMKLEGIGMFYLAVKSYPRATDKVALREWLEQKGYGWEMVLAYNAMKFQGFYNELMENKKELPTCVEQYTTASVKMRKE